MIHLLRLLIVLVVAGICGSLGMALGGRKGRGGCILSIAVGFIGALLGGYLSSVIGLPEVFTIAGFPVLWSIIASALFVAVLNLISRGR